MNDHSMNFRESLEDNKQLLSNILGQTRNKKDIFRINFFQNQKSILQNEKKPNAGNFLTDKPITQVLAPPGGRSSITFG